MAVARETLSPLFKNSQARRLSLELCQKLGFSNLFNNSSSSPVKSPCENLNISKTELKTPSPNKSFTHWPQNANIASTNFRNSSTQKPYANNCRRGSDSFRWNCSPLSSTLQKETPNKQSPIRRGSLTLTQFKDTHRSILPSGDNYGQNQYNPWGPRRNSISVLLQDENLDNIIAPCDCEDAENGNCKNCLSSAKYPERAAGHGVPLEEIFNDNEKQNEDWWPRKPKPFTLRNNEPYKKNCKSPSNKNDNAGKSTATKVTCKLIPPSPKSSLKTELEDENDNIYPCSPIDIFPTEAQAFNTSVSNAPHPHDQSPFLWKEEERRKSSSSRYDFDNDFMDFVAVKCNLELNPEDILGRGSFGIVITANYHGKPVAVKLVNTKSAKHSESMKSEENAMYLPSHPNIAKVLDIFQLGPDKALVIMERLRKGNLLAILNDPRISIQTPLKLKLCIEIGSALVFCHVHGILHLDVKPQNVLIDYEDRCRLSDFGSSRKMSELQLMSDFNKLDGTVPYKAPELFRGICPSDKCDVYSFGISMWQILTRETPYKAEADHSIIYKVVSQGLRPCSKYSVSSHQLQLYIQIYEECWCQEPTSRPNMNVVLQKLNQIKL